MLPRFGHICTWQVRCESIDQRYYNNWYGRFLTADPLGQMATSPKNPTTWNMYAYANGDPINFSDPQEA
jgi:RHS repeat-associated protein